MTSAFIRDTRGQVKKETEIAVMWSQAEGRLGLPEGGKGKERCFPRLLGGAQVGAVRSWGTSIPINSFQPKTTRNTLVVKVEWIGFLRWRSVEHLGKRVVRGACHEAGVYVR